MSVQDFPRIYFNGNLGVNPATGNNNDNFFIDGSDQSAVTYFGGRVELNWSLIGQPSPTVEDFPSNRVSQSVRKAIREWFISFIDNSSGKSELPAEWNYYGGNQAVFLQFPGDDTEQKPAQLTTPVGGAFGPTTPADADDPFLINSQVFLVGDGHSTKQAFAGPPNWPTTSDPGPAGRLIDVDPLSTWSTQIFYKYIFIGQPGCGIIMARTALFQLRYYLNWANWQTAVENGSNLWIENPVAGATGHSPLLAAFQQALTEPENKGLIFSFNTLFLTPDDPAGIGYVGGGPFNNAQFPYAQYDGQPELATLYAEQLNLEFPVLKQNSIGLDCPSYPTAVGTVGIWKQGESLRTAPQGRYLLNSLLGFIVVSISLSVTDGGWLHLSFMNSQSFVGTLNIGIVTNDDSFQLVLSQLLGAYQDTSNGAILDIQLTPDQIIKLQARAIEIRLVPSNKLIARTRTPVPADITVFKEQDLVANTDQRSIYSDAGSSSLAPITIAVTDRGKPAAAGTNVLVVKYQHVPSPLVSPIIVTKSDEQQVMELWNSAGTSSIEQTIAFTTANVALGETLAAIVQTDSDGNASLSVKSLDDGFGLLLFLPYTDELPLPDTRINPANLSYSCLRIWPDDSADETAFKAAYNAAIPLGQDAVRHAAWKYVYDNILYLYDMLFPVMLRYLPLNDLDQIEASIDGLIQVLEAGPENTVLMPVTRDLSTGKHTVLLSWALLVKAGYPLDSLK